MRRGNKSFWIENEDSLVGVNLGADYCAEHEFGIERLQYVLGIPSADEADAKRVFASKRFQVSKVPQECLRWAEDGDEAYLLFSYYFNSEDPAKLGSVAIINKDTYYGQELRLPNFDFEKLRAKREKVKFEEPTELMTTGWSEKDFGIHVKGAVNFSRLKSIYEALLQKDLALFFGNEGNPFQNAGLQLIIVSRIPKEGEKSIKDSLKDAYNLKKAAKKTGIADRLKKAKIGKGRLMKAQQSV